jgi:hypothetical protein
LGQSYNTIDLGWDSILLHNHQPSEWLQTDVIKLETDLVLHLNDLCIDDAAIVTIKLPRCNNAEIGRGVGVILVLLAGFALLTLQDEPVGTGINDHLHVLVLLSDIQDSIVQMILEVGDVLLIIETELVHLSSKPFGGLTSPLSFLLKLVLLDLL